MLLSKILGGIFFLLMLASFATVGKPRAFDRIWPFYLGSGICFLASVIWSTFDVQL
jgi:4-amino-4-deoxy-L-arabinose transferase-like glycosyltransferase